MIWLIGNKGMLGSAVEKVLRGVIPYNAPARGWSAFGGKESAAEGGLSLRGAAGDAAIPRKSLGRLLRFTRNDNDDNIFTSDKEVDITDIKALEKAAEKLGTIDWIINCAAYTAVEKAETEKELAFKLNADGPANIAQVAKKHGAKLIHISTDYVFDGTKDGVYLETDRTNPLNVYGASKLEGENNIRNILAEHFIIRTSWLFGRGGANFVDTMLRLFKEKSEVKVVMDQYGSPTYAPDLAAAILKIIEADSEDYGTYHFTNEGTIDWYGFAREIYDLAFEHAINNKIETITPIATDEYPSKMKRPANSCLSKEKFKRVFDVHIRNWQMALEEYIVANMSS